MRPAIRTGDAIVVGGKSPFELAPDDIALYEREGHLYAHRFVGWTRDASGQPALGFRGDACGDLDPLVAPEALIGSVMRVEPAARRAFGWTGRTAIAGRLVRFASRGARALGLTATFWKLPWLGAVMPILVGGLLLLTSRAV